MTCIVGFSDGETVYIGADTIGVSNNKKTIRKDSKVFLNKNMLFGFTDSFRMGQLLQFKLKIPTHIAGKSDYEYMCTTFIDSVIKCFEDNKFNRNDNGEIAGGSFLVGYKGNLYLIDSDYQVGLPADKYMAVGAGEEYALGSLYTSTLFNIKDISDIVLFALKSASKSCPYATGPYNIMSINKNGNLEKNYKNIE